MVRTIQVIVYFPVDDYTLVTPTITLGPETLQATVTINITNDLFTEQDEFLQVIASSLDQSVDILNSTVNVTIDSDDSKCLFISVLLLNVVICFNYLSIDGIFKFLCQRD